MNDAVLYGRNHVEVVSVLRDSPRHVRIVCARPHDTVNSLCSIAAANPAVAQSLFKAKSEQVLLMVAFFPRKTWNQGNVKELEKMVRESHGLVLKIRKKC